MTITTKIIGNAMQMVVCQLGEGQTLYAEAGKFLWKTVNVGIETKINTPSSAGGGGGGGFLNAALSAGKRMLAGESLAFQYFTAAGNESGRQVAYFRCCGAVFEDRAWFSGTKFAEAADFTETTFGGPRM